MGNHKLIFELSALVPDSFTNDDILVAVNFALSSTNIKVVFVGRTLKDNIMDFG